MQPELLLKFKRNQLTEREHSGNLLLADKTGKILFQLGNFQNNLLFLRSCAKPAQAIPVIRSKTLEKFNFSLAELAVICASHTASQDHLLLIKSILEKINLTEKDLKCCSHYPFDNETKQYLIKNNIEPQNIHNNCSGKHAGMLAVCRNKNWETKNYLEFDHPLQQEYLKIIKEIFDTNTVELGIDGCGAPVHAIPFDKIGAGFLNLFLNPEFISIKKAFIENPLIIGGKGKVDSSIIKASNGRLIAKNGAEGLIVIINTIEEKSLTIKISDGNLAARDIVALNTLEQLDWLSKEELNSPEIKELYNLEIKNLHNNVVGEIIPQFKF